MRTVSGFNFGTGAPPNVITNGLVLWLDASNLNSYTGSGTTWRDMSGSANNGTLTNGPGFTANNGGAIVFDGSNDYAPIGSSGFPFGSSSGSLSAWARVNTVNTGTKWIISYGNPAQSQSRYIGTFNATYYFGAFGNDITASGVVVNTWFNMVGVYDGTNASMYINGSLVSGPTAKTWNTVASNAQVGRQTNGFEYFSGTIGVVSVYNRVLSANEVLRNFTALRGRYGI